MQDSPKSLHFEQISGWVPTGSALPHGSLRCGWTVPAAPRLRRLSTGFAGLGVLRLKTSPPPQPRCRNSGVANTQIVPPSEFDEDRVWHDFAVQVRRAVVEGHPAGGA